ncbi:MAG TPA: hypothetical protein PKW08_08495 [Flavobacteriaceae bacterium]|nr:hypothetical protein [Flavobacteriaceae bacterium]HPF12433.1 hypothetical protein [Flavobacteriaceae bacterium]HQU21616.1 hypothetical protein [Flavobacteriaceae bacterium]HQU66191.1 hypothetical protein [Flavobacteriaceae bacterium]
MKAFLKYIGFIVLVTALLATLISISSLRALRNASFYKPSFLANQVSETNFDYIVLGSSVGLTSLNTNRIDSILGTKGLNLSMDDTGMSTHYLMLEHFLKEGKSTRYCILAPGLASLENKKAGFSNNDYRFLMYVQRDYVYDYYKNNPEANNATNVLFLSKWVPFLGVGYYNTELFFPSLNAAIHPEQRNRFDARGNYGYPKKGDSLDGKEEIHTAISFQHPYLDKIETLCKNNNIRLIYYLSPIYKQTLSYEKPNFPLIDHTQFFKEAGNFYDRIHVNSEGREKVSLQFAEEFKKIKKENQLD